MAASKRLPDYEAYLNYFTGMGFPESYATLDLTQYAFAQERLVKLVKKTASPLLMVTATQAYNIAKHADRSHVGSIVLPEFWGFLIAACDISHDPIRETKVLVNTDLTFTFDATRCWRRTVEPSDDQEPEGAAWGTYVLQSLESLVKIDQTVNFKIKQQFFHDGLNTLAQANIAIYYGNQMIIHRILVMENVDISRTDVRKTVYSLSQLIGKITKLNYEIITTLYSMYLNAIAPRIDEPTLVSTLIEIFYKNLSCNMWTLRKIIVDTNHVLLRLGATNYLPRASELCGYCIFHNPNMVNYDVPECVCAHTKRIGNASPLVAIEWLAYAAGVHEPFILRKGTTQATTVAPVEVETAENDF